MFKMLSLNGQLSFKIQAQAYRLGPKPVTAKIRPAGVVFSSKSPTGTGLSLLPRSKPVSVLMADIIQIRN